MLNHLERLEVARAKDLTAHRQILTPDRNGVVVPPVLD